ncbi:MAG: hypothetical protein K0S61_1788 [Anaerocolumna sp.]|jgi:hypothetical protein|nr:hypothetical protein [Anaerocolumna sp.]
MKKIKKLFIFPGVALLITLSIIYFYPKRLNSEYSGVMYRIGDSKYSENIKILIDGYYSKGLLKGDKFKGVITIGEKQFTRLDMRFNSGRELLSFYNEEKGDYISYGDMFINNKLEEFSICILEEDGAGKGGKSWSAKDGLMISAPVNSRDEAVKLSNSLLKDYLFVGLLQ